MWKKSCIVGYPSSKVFHKIVFPGGKKVKLTGDEVPALIILFLANCDSTKVADLYPQIQFLESYLPDFMASGHIGFTVATILSAYAYILKRMEDVRRSNCSVESEAEEAQENPGITQSVPNDVGWFLRGLAYGA